MKQSRTRQDGLVSVIVVAVITVIISLLTIGFSIIMDRQLRLTTDRELAAQATYAAESGINDASAYIKQQLASGNNNPSTGNGCLNVNSYLPPSGPFVKNGSLSGDYNNDPNDNNTKYTCIIINARPPSLVYPIDAGKSATFKMIPYDNSGNPLSITDLYFSWQNKSYDSTGPKRPLPGADVSHTLPKESDYNDSTKCPNLNCTGMLEVTIYPIYDDSAGALSNSTTGPNVANQDAAIAQNARTYFMYANSANGSSFIGAQPYSVNGQFIDGNCSSNPPVPPFATFNLSYCNSEVKSLPAGVSFYYISIRSLYTNQTVTIQAAHK